MIQPLVTGIKFPIQPAADLLESNELPFPAARVTAIQRTLDAFSHYSYERYDRLYIDFEGVSSFRTRRLSNRFCGILIYGS